VQFPWAQVAGSGAPHEDSYRLQDNLRLSAADALDRGCGDSEVLFYVRESFPDKVEGLFPLIRKQVAWAAIAVAVSVVAGAEKLPA
jgi:hypothetical protein